jgi:cell fate (sporulation/competence/biofilm development) regulator YlbF (YheA/YmcA/DUF963 family)
MQIKPILERKKRMDLQINPIPAPTTVKRDLRQSAQALGHLLRQTPEYEAFLKALKAVNNDLTVQRLGAQMRGHQNALQWGRDDSGQHAAELERLELEMEALPLVKAYRQAEMEVQQLFQAVDEIVSQEAGVAFAANAKPGGCCG